jgi:hypothetical protein
MQPVFVLLPRYASSLANSRAVKQNVEAVCAASTVFWWC